MDRLNKLVSESLKQQPAGPHPDADTLASFVENALGRPERQQTLAHLAECSDCREILYLAQPDLVATQPAVVYRPNRVTHFALRWGAVAASLVIVAGGLFITRHELFVSKQKAAQQRTPASYDKLAEKKAPAELDSVRSAEAPAAQKQLPAVTKTRPTEKHMTAKPQANMSFDESGQVRVLNENESARTASGAGSATGTDANSLAAYDKRSKQRDESVSANAPSASTVNVVGGDVAQNRSDGKDTPAAPESAQVSRSAPAVQTEAEPMVRAGAAAKLGSHRDEQAFKQTGAFMKALAAPVASWEVASNGGVQRSLDSGKTWQSVSVGGKGAIFNAVFSSGTQVWVGGIAGALYHSADSGLTWAKVIPATDGQTLKADISHIEFSDPQTGAVSATNGEVWLTSDAGQTWRRKSANPAN
jgi:hypothetical protein